ncbi:MAG: hypothetical protein A3E87_09715 [Gammaproteobacteria bacterium RIFCSPHIGHO2_12_FULL_35_23]|nr:MAG: hypothetical protein A3E87_09715 [Gammaproteobacteria bacterium RIFCSPHIGHO2_12_FULL_35_23]
MKTKLNAIEINADNPQASIIWLHGLGASGDDFVSIVPLLSLANKDQIRFIFPHAPKRPITLNYGYVMPGWFDIYSLDFNGPQDTAGILEAYQNVSELITKEINLGIPSHNIIVAGFSQGGALALYTALHYPQKLAGVIGLSTFLPLSQDLAKKMSAANRKLPVFLGHGSKDGLVSIQLGEITNQLLTDYGYPVDWHAYPIEHTVGQAEIKDISAWLQKRLSFNLVK